MEVREGDSRDIEYVMKRLWDRGVKELKNYGFEKDFVLREFLAFPREYFFSFYHEDEPVAVCGGVPDYLGEHYHTWFLATDRFPEIAFSATRFLRKFLKTEAEKPHVKSIKLASAVDHPAAGRWFGVLGFQLIKFDPPFHHYEYQKELTRTSV